MKLLLATLTFASLTPCAMAKTPDGKHKLILMAGKPSHPPRMHEFNAGVQLLAGCLKDVKALEVKTLLNGWPQDESVFEGADAVVFYMDGGKKHEAVQEEGKRLAKIDQWVKNGVSIGCLHYGVTVDPPDNGGEQFKRWIGGHYEENFSCNPIWEPNFVEFPIHPITRGVKPFHIKDEWYFNIRFADGLSADMMMEKGAEKFMPILVAKPSDAVRNGPYVYPAGPYPHIQAAKGRQEAMMWAIERADGGRGLGFTGGHFHDNWANDEFRKTVLNSLVWLAKLEVPESGIASTVTKEQLEANLDPKPQKKTAAAFPAREALGAPGQPRRPAVPPVPQPPQQPPAPVPQPQPFIIGVFGGDQRPANVATPTTPSRFATRGVGVKIEAEGTIKEKEKTGKDSTPAKK